MDDLLEIQTFGGLVVTCNGTPIEDFDQRKVPALLVYLARTERPQPREVLAEIFWEARTQSQSLANLRVALSNLRKTVGPFVTITRDTASMCPQAHWRLDAATFEHQLSHSDGDIQQLEDAIAFYQGDFLDGFYIDSQAFEDWTLLERERLRFRVIEALDRLIEGHLGQGEYTKGIEQATRLLKLDTLREKTYRQLMHLFALAGERTTALSYYRTCCQMLETEFGTQPTAETTALADRIQANQILARVQPVVISMERDPAPDILARPRHNLRPQPTSFVGREAEVTAVIEQLKNPECRLLTLVGPGGIGKTRLALAVAERLLDDFDNGVFYVSLASLNSSENLASAISGAVGLDFLRRGRDAEQELLHFLHAKDLLLVLDNFEHLLTKADLVGRILAMAPSVTVLVTSRQPLNLGWEWLFEVRGLRHPAASADDHMEDYGAIQLFVERARRVKPDFRLAAVSDSVISICQRVEGMPLGIEIAAAWVRMLPCEMIADELLALELPQRDVPARHRSIQSLFDYTWQHLSPAEQNAFKGLSVFRGSFTAEAAEAVTGASFGQLVAFVNKSLLRCDSANRRYNMHDLLREYAVEQLCEFPDEYEMARQQHSEYYCGFMAEQRDNIVKGEVGDVLRDFSNVLAAWDWAVCNAQLDLIAQSMHSLLGVFERRLLETLGRQTFRGCGHTLAHQLPPSPERDVIVAQLLAIESGYTNEPAQKRELAEESFRLAFGVDDLWTQGFVEYCSWHAFPPDERERHLRHSVELYKAVGDKLGTAKSILALGSFFFREQMKLEQSLAEVEIALHLFRELENPHGILLALINVGNVLSSQYHFDRARRCFEEALVIAESFDPPNMQMIAGCLNNIAFLAIKSGANLESAEELAKQAVAIRKEYGNPQDLLIVLDTLATLKYERGDYISAEALFRECLELTKSIEDVPAQWCAAAHGRIGLVAQATDNMQDAYYHLSNSLVGAITCDSAIVIVDIMVIVAMAFAREGRKARALELLGFTIPRPAIDKLIFDEARLRAELEAEFGPDAIEAAIARNSDVDAVELAREVLAELEQR